MIALRRSGDRQHVVRRDRQLWQTFPAEGFGALELLDEKRLAPRATATTSRRAGDQVFTWVIEGAIAQAGMTIGAGEFQCMTAGPQRLPGDTNPSRTRWAHYLQLSLRPSMAPRVLGCEQRRYSAAQRHGVLCVVASPDRHAGSLLLHQDAVIYSVVLTRGQHPVHELLPGRAAWLHLVCGEATLGDLVLQAGDGVGLTGERVVSVTASEPAELLLIDLGPACGPAEREAPQ
ncbi:MAG: hypothetical protein IPJ65_40170 [Archangiaceae bacterium]|nr:hypothetical protein [Archangiaceae bacterium]